MGDLFRCGECETVFPPDLAVMVETKEPGIYLYGCPSCSNTVFIPVSDPNEQKNS